MIPVTEHQLELMATNNFYSTEREILCNKNTLYVLVSSYADLVQHKRYETDSQTGYYSVMSMKDNAATFPVVKDVRLVCAEHDIEIDVVWRPREDPNQQIADVRSMMVDNSAWTLHNKAYEYMLGCPNLEGKQPSIDIFASSATTQVQGSYYCKFLDLDTQGVDAFVPPWAACSKTGRRHLAYINGPFHKMGVIIRKIKDEQVDCVLLGPKWPRSWVATLQ